MKLVNGSKKQTIVSLENSINRSLLMLHPRVLQKMELEEEVAGSLQCIFELIRRRSKRRCKLFATDDSDYCRFHQ